jgi:CubicO group peptidase (beta-lactamase class C family)
VEEGKLSLEDKVCDYLPEIKNAFIINSAGQKEYVGHTMTVRNLFTMTAGFTHDIYKAPVLELIKESQGKATLRDFIPKFIESPLAFAPGDKYQYGINHDILAAVIEVVTGKKFSAYVKEVIFEPLQMNESRFDNGEENMADVYWADANGGVRRIIENKFLVLTPAYECGGAGLVSTVEDYIRFADALACGGIAANGYQVLSKEMLHQLTSEQLKEISISNNFACVQGGDYGYGLGVRIRQKATDWGLNRGEFGWDGAAGSYVMIDPAQRLSIFFAMHVRSWPSLIGCGHAPIRDLTYEALGL